MGIGTDSYTEHKGTKSLLGAIRVRSLFLGSGYTDVAEVKTELKVKIYAPGNIHIKPRFKGKSLKKKKKAMPSLSSGE